MDGRLWRCIGGCDQNHLQEKKMQKSKMVVWGGFKNSGEKKWNAKEKRRYAHLNAEFQRIAMKDKKAFLSDQGKEIEENNRMGKTSDLFKKSRDAKGTFHARMGTIKDRNVKNLQKQKRWRRGIQEYTEEPYKK